MEMNDGAELLHVNGVRLGIFDEPPPARMVPIRVAEWK